VRAIPLKRDDLPPTVAESWTNLQTAVLVQRVRADKRVTLDSAYYVTSHKPDPKLLATQIRDHWKIENELHHCLDVSFDEDRRKIRHENGAQNFALVTRYALSLIKREPSKMSVAMKRRKAAWSKTYLFDVLTAGFAGV
jgi:predicted transposase YbfD/YdcC